MSENLRYWIWLQNALGYGAKINKIIGEYKSAKVLYDLGEDEWRMSPVLSYRQVEKMINTDIKMSDKVIFECMNNGYKAVDFEDVAYPERLKEIPNPPAVLYIDGVLPDIDNLVCIGMVGTRKASEYAIKAAHIMAKGITEAGALVVSGGALGVDTYSHLGALACGGKTVAVLGSGLGSNYLKSNENLRNMIRQNGALVTEYQPNEPVSRRSFPLRNRIISGLSLGVLVVEAGIKSGSLITARLATEQGRDIYAIPSSIFSSEYSGTNKLIEDGAKVAVNPINVVEAYEEDYPTLNLSKIRGSNEIALDDSETRLDTSIVKKKTAKELNAKPTPENNQIDKKYSFEKLEEGRKNRIKIEENAAKLEGEYKTVYDCIGENFTHVDEIIMKSGLPASKVLAALTFLEIKKLIISASGKRFKKS